jgi:hypothetical protein
MAELKVTTWRVHRNVVERLAGWETAYRCRVTNGYRIADSRGPTREAAEESAKQNWIKEFGEVAK